MPLCVMKNFLASGLYPGDGENTDAHSKRNPDYRIGALVCRTDLGAGDSDEIFVGSKLSAKPAIRKS